MSRTGDTAPVASSERILSLLQERRDSFVSGAELSRMMDISRSAVWKQVTSLRNLGYEISAEPSKGYRLESAPDSLLPAEIRQGLRTEVVGSKIICLQETVSTNTVAFRMAEDGAPEGTTVVADCQTGGKGRLGRVWASPPGVNLYCSVILRPPIQPMAAPQLTFLSVVALARAIERLTPLSPRIKWPNDILIDGRKVAGLLNEMSAETDKVNFVVLGIGVNLNMTTDQFPVDLRHPATSLFIECGTRVRRTDFARCLFHELDEVYGIFLREGYGPVRSEWLQRSRLAGEMVTVSDNGRVTTGRVLGIDEYGALLLEGDDGATLQVLAGDVRLVNG
ncbi:MAG TPA: biotin--[acetyl-CoA-carboxylase] ligase [Geobacteraceae bacterium]|nr:biotin--[acetyl-CoA-carboxylase] ligase [Geobacteraceae bacterium]